MALHEAAEANAVEVTKFLIEERGHAVDAVDDQCWTPLHYAAAFAGPELVCGRAEIFFSEKSYTVVARRNIHLVAAAPPRPTSALRGITRRPRRSTSS